MNRDEHLSRYDAYVAEVSNELNLGKSIDSEIREHFRRMEEEFYIPPRDAVRTVIRMMKKRLFDEPSVSAWLGDSVGNSLDRFDFTLSNLDQKMEAMKQFIREYLIEASEEE